MSALLNQTVATAAAAALGAKPTSFAATIGMRKGQHHRIQHKLHQRGSRLQPTAGSNGTAGTSNSNPTCPDTLRCSVDKRISAASAAAATAAAAVAAGGGTAANLVELSCMPRRILCGKTAAEGARIDLCCRSIATRSTTNNSSSLSTYPFYYFKKAADVHSRITCHSSSSSCCCSLLLNPYIRLAAAAGEAAGEDDGGS